MVVRNRHHKPRILVLFSDTGGGHRSAAQAIIEALEDKRPGYLDFDMVDVFKAYAPYPLNRMPEWYPEMVKAPRLWSLGYRAVDGRRRARFFLDSLWPWVRPASRQLVREHPADLVLSVHPLFSFPVLRALGKHHPPIITVVTDLVTAPLFWFHPRVDACVVPTELTRRTAMEMGMHEDQVKLLGLPVSRKFSAPADKMELRRQLGWPTDRPMVLLIGGGDGMGPIFETAHAIAATSPECGLAVVTGRNEKLKAKIDNGEWAIPVINYGFVGNMPDLMRAADILVTKAGPGTICEALNAGLPIVLYSRIPGQEDGNVRYVVEEGAGRWAPGADRTSEAVRRLLHSPALMKQTTEACRRIAYPHASADIADLILDWLEKGQSVKGSLKS